MAVKTIFDRSLESVADFVWTSVSQITLPASTLLIDGNYYSAGALVFDFANGTGDNGLDTGAEANNQWYALYAVPGTAGAYKLKASVNLPAEAGGAGPTGFPKYRYLGLFRNGDQNANTNDIIRFSKDKDTTYLMDATGEFGLRLASPSGSQSTDWTVTTGMSGQTLPWRGTFKFRAATTGVALRILVRVQTSTPSTIDDMQFSADNSGYGAQGHTWFHIPAHANRINLYVDATVNTQERRLTLLAWRDPYLSE